jgi:SagB-type dehydrogenase family enzyme
MSKLAWVLLPALLAAALLLLRRRALGRPMLNALFSLLLLAYIATTAGLGLFWVANQQLPAFDWHYLFGYATLALLVLHLGFNLPTVWRLLRRRALAAPAGAPAPAARRPWLLGTTVAAAAAGLGYAIGLRHGRVELHISAAGAARAPGAPDAGLALVESFHALSSHSRRSVLRHAGTAQWGDAPPPFKRYAGAARVRLPPPGSAAAGAGDKPDLAALADMLWHCAGVSLERGGIHFRTSPSSGALFATELYLRSDEVPPLQGLWWHYDAAGHALESTARPARREALGALAVSGSGAGSTLIVATAIFARSGHKYGDRTWRFVLADAGHALQNLLAVAQALGTKAQLAARFDDLAIGQALGLERLREGVLAVLVLAPGEGELAPAAARAWQRSLAWRNADSAAELTAAMHLASALEAASGAPLVAPAPPALAARAAPSAAAQAAAPMQSLPAAVALPADPRSLIARRRSVRRFASRALTQRELATLLVAARGPGSVLSQAMHIDVITPAVAGLAAAAWMSAGAALVAGRGEALSARGLRTRARAAGLDQDVIGDAAAVIVLSLERAVLVGDALGAARAYRHGFVEAGLAGERVYLAAAALGLGCCSVGAFYDEEVAALVGRDPARFWVVHLVAVGPPA